MSKPAETKNRVLGNENILFHPFVSQRNEAVDSNKSVIKACISPHSHNKYKPRHTHRHTQTHIVSQRHTLADTSKPTITTCGGKSERACAYKIILNYTFVT